ncbi:efflux RND transporter periplasmic adaptor subunit [uncultured Roseobacter sp.]|uniref:efflux RND transporter periplasmic adaptor subunit n=1 Tax=uncultured Roseobacter sp. TaxID=114847 RepID=UPI002618A67D|nr:efflux RND transporter periplasmic adaptor subunit [uncultured Roseobacter sp.]
MRLAIILSMAVVWASAGGAQDAPGQPPRPAKVITVEESARTIERRYPAIVQPSQEAVLSFKVSGEVVELPVRGATNVVEGDVIARLDQRAFEEAVAQLQSQRDQAVAQLQILRRGARDEEVSALEADVAAAQAQVDQAQDQLERTRQLAERGVVSEARLEQDDAAAQVARAALQASLEQLAIGRAGGREEDISAAEAVIRGFDSQLRTALDNLNDATLRAPFDGIIARRDIDNFTNVSAGQSVVLLQALETVDLVFDVPGPDVLIWSAREDVSSSVLLEARPGQAIPAELVEFSTQADLGTQTYRARVGITVPEGAQVLPGMVGTVIVSSGEQAAAAMRIPFSAIGTDTGANTFVWIVDETDSSVSARPVSLGDVAGDEVDVLEGLSAGEVIVTAGVSYLREGAVIRPVSRIGE